MISLGCSSHLGLRFAGYMSAYNIAIVAANSGKIRIIDLRK
jgi:hypothetical protein